MEKEDNPKIKFTLKRICTVCNSRKDCSGKKFCQLKLHSLDELAWLQICASHDHKKDQGRNE